MWCSLDYWNVYWVSLWLVIVPYISLSQWLVNNYIPIALQAVLAIGSLVRIHNTRTNRRRLFTAVVSEDVLELGVRPAHHCRPLLCSSFYSILFLLVFIAHPGHPSTSIDKLHCMLITPWWCWSLHGDGRVAQLTLHHWRHLYFWSPFLFFTVDNFSRSYSWGAPHCIRIWGTSLLTDLIIYTLITMNSTWWITD